MKRICERQHETMKGIPREVCRYTKKKRTFVRAYICDVVLNIERTTLFGTSHDGRRTAIAQLRYAASVQRLDVMEAKLKSENF